MSRPRPDGEDGAEAGPEGTVFRALTETVATETPAPSGPPRALARGTSVGRYVVLEPIGRGGMGVVYRAWDPELSRPIALKLVDTPERTSAAVRDRLLREAQALAQLSHPHVVGVHDVGQTEAGVFVAMELVDGAPLGVWLRARPRSTAEVLAIFVQAGEGLAAAHAAGLVHRDIKPANLLVGVDGRARVVDFGLARPAETGDGSRPPHAEPVPDADDGDDDDDADDGADQVGIETRTGGARRAAAAARTPSGTFYPRLDTPLTAAGAVLGTPSYMAPEQHAGAPATPATDQFSFCVTLWEALFGQRPFHAPTRPELRLAIERGAIERPAGARVPAHVEAALRRGLAADPVARWPSLPALLDELRRDPARRRRRALAVTGGLVVALALGAGWIRGRHPGPGPCPAAEATLADVWNDARRQELRAAFAATGLPFAHDAAAGVERVIDGYASAWSAQRIEACRATRVRGEQSERLLDLRMRCLSRRREGLRAQVDIFAAADASVVARAIPAAQALAPLDDCADGAMLERAVPPPADRATRLAVEEAGRALERVTALLASGRYPDGLARIEPIARDAERLGYPPLVAEVELRRGSLLDRTGDVAGAERAFWAAVIAADRGRLDELRAEALAQLIWIVGERNGRYLEARRIAEQARGAIDRLDRPERVLARYHRALGVIGYRQGRYLEALDHSEHATELARRAFGPDHPYLASCVMDVGLASFFLGRYDQAQVRVEQALAIYLRVYGMDHGDVAAAHDNLGEIARRRGDTSRAIAEYRAAAAIWERLGSVEVANAYANIAEIERTSGQLELAAADYARARERLTGGFGADHPRQVAVLLGLGHLALDQRDPGRAVTLLEDALRIDELHPGDAVQRAEVELALARALRDGEHRGARVRGLARAALLRFAAAGPPAAARAAEALALLAAP